jgi:hypothetical protein
MSFYVGQVVVCVDDKGFPYAEGEADGERYPKGGGVYTIRAIRVDGDDVGLLLAELVNPWFEWDGGNKGEISFHVSRFRPAKTTSLEVFEGMLAPDFEPTK